MSKEFTVRHSVERTFTEGYGVSIEPLYDWDDELDEPAGVSDIVVEVVRIAADTVSVVGGVPCVETDFGSVPVENFLSVDDLSVDDTHDLRTRFFHTEDAARAHAEYTESRFRNPSPWESFIQV